MATATVLKRWAIGGRVKVHDLISTAPLDKQYAKVCKETQLGRVFRILEKEPYAVVVDSEKSVGMYFEMEKWACPILIVNILSIGVVRNNQFHSNNRTSSG